MFRTTTIAMALLLSGWMLHPPSAGDTGREFTINVPESRVEFFVGTAIGDVNGVFKGWTGALKVASVGHPETATLGVDVSTGNMTTGSGSKDKMIKGKDFFYVEKYPSITFTSTKVVPSNDPNKFQVEGDFMLRGVTKPVVMQVTLARDAKGGGQVYADLSFDRRDFGMTKNIPFARISDSIRVRMDLYVEPKPAAN